MLTKEIKKALKKESKNFPDKKTNNLQNVYKTLSKHGLLVKSEYSFPLKDTLGKTYFEQIQFSDSQHVKNT